MNEIILTIGAIILGLSPIFAILGVIYYYDKKAKKNKEKLREKCKVCDKYKSSESDDCFDRSCVFFCNNEFCKNYGLRGKTVWLLGEVDSK